ncbi:hypothetical protein SAMN02910265_03029 [Ruminococcus flavefaciens]|uniref:Uncharacterized protein n=1 Tax=Ruminococcus flavefaciens TaxID=1265 RepID=A0A1H6LJH3_RUMFL|nr:hypothetical protein [Ruminococcus flavefaciens]SEH84939.1 hypothetical protein SAMN02910265_03029 [Ruminococcus flavefaciens]
MTVNNNGYAVKVTDISSLYELVGSAEQLSNACLVIVYPQISTVVGNSEEEISAVRELLKNAGFITAAAFDDDTDEQLAHEFDLRLKSSEVDEYVEKLFKDKTEKQIKEINACFTASRTAPAEKVLEIESKAFYRLMADKNGGNSNE